MRSLIRMKSLVGATLLIVCMWQGERNLARAQTPPDNPHFLTAPAEGVSREDWLEDALAYRQRVRREIAEGPTGIHWKNRDRPDLSWMSHNFTCAMCMMYDTGFYDAESHEYPVESILADGRKEFGGYDSIVLWHAYPRLGIDERNQFDFYRDMPGGLPGIRSLVERCHAQNVRVFVDYNPWDTGTRREQVGDHEALARLVTAIDADGVFLDTLSEGSVQLREVLDRTKPGLALVSEGHPPFEQLAICSGSWGQWLEVPKRPGILKLKWVDPRHMQYQIRRWDRSRSEEIAVALFNGSGMLVWENVFGTYNPWKASDRRAWKKANLILHCFAECFASPGSRPYYPSLHTRVSIHHWPRQDYDIFVLQNRGAPLTDERIFKVAHGPSTRFYDLWNGLVIEPEIEGDEAILRCTFDELGCILAVKNSAEIAELADLLDQLAKTTAESETAADVRNFAKPVNHADPVAATPRVPRGKPPSGMVYVPGCVKTFEIEHVRGECGCYPDSEPPADENDFGFGLQADATYPEVIHQPIKHVIGPKTIAAFWIDQSEVTNAQYKKFLDESGYRPRHEENFLKHWPKGELPESLADHPVVYIDIDDARAYAQWAGKRLPTEYEWQLAAQGPGNRKWPWGNRFDPDKCNTTATATMPVRSYPEGRSPYGCYHMSGNVWEWTESCRDDGHTRFTMIRGGSYYRAEGSLWYVQGGPQPCGHHAKFLRVWPGLDRCSTVGFRCVVDAE